MNGRLPAIAQVYALPGDLRQEGVLRYGFHGLSYEYIVHELRREAGPQAADGRILIAHLGNGSSMAAVRHGRSVDTTMGFTPAGGLAGHEHQRGVNDRTAYSRSDAWEVK